MGKTQLDLMAKAIGKDPSAPATDAPATEAKPETKPEAKPEGETAKPEVKTEGKPTTEGAEKKPQSAPTLEQSAGKKATDSPKPAQAEDKKGADAVPVWKLLDLKNQITELKQSQAEDKQLIQEAVTLLKDLKSNGATKSEEKTAKEAFAEKWGANPEFLEEFAKVFGVNPADAKTAEKKLLDDTKPTAEAKPAEAKADEKPTFDNDQLERAIDEQLVDFLKEAPEFSDVVNPDTIKAIVFSNPGKYTQKNIADIVEEAYGKAIPSKRGADGYKPTGAGAEKIDYSKVRGDSEEWKQIQADPTLKAEYVDSVTKRLQGRL